MDGYHFLICLVTAISFCSSAPESLDTLTINLNIDGESTDPTPTDPTPTPTDPTPTAPPIDYDCTCGIKNPKIIEPTARIVGGHNTGIFEYPWMVSLKAYWPFPWWHKMRHSCGGVLIASRWILTAAHCLKKFDTFYMWIGEHDQTTIYETNKTFIWLESKRISHPDYNGLENDIGLIKLDEDVDLTIYTPVCLPDANQFFHGMNGTVLGWGRTKAGPPPGPFEPLYLAKQLQSVSAIAGDDEYCETKIELSMDGGLTCSTQLGISGKGECFGDSGGPMTVEFYGRHYLNGVVNGGKGGCAVGGVTLYSSAAKQRNWIDQTIQENGGAAYCTPTPFPFDRDEE